MRLKRYRSVFFVVFLVLLGLEIFALVKSPFIFVGLEDRVWPFLLAAFILLIASFVPWRIFRNIQKVVNLAFLIFLGFSFVNIFWLDFKVIAFLIATCILGGIKLLLEHLNKKKDLFLKEDVYKYLFLAMLVLISLGSFFDFFSSKMTGLSIITILLGVFVFYYNRDVIDEIEEEKEDEEKAEQKRAKEFDRKFPKLAWFNFDYGITKNWKEKRYFVSILRALAAPFIWFARLPYSFVKWMYKEGWWYSLALIGIVLAFFALRLYSMNYLDGGDLYNDVAIKNLYENGHSFYKYSNISTFLMLLSVNIFGFSIPALKVPFILFSFITLICLYFLAKLIDKKIALISSLLFTISPWGIIVSKMTRDYSFDCMIGVIVLLICLHIYRKSKKSSVKKIILNIGWLSLLVIGIYLITQINNRIQTLIVAIFPFITGIFLFYECLRKSPKLNKQTRTICSTIMVFSIVILIYYGEKWPFEEGFDFKSFYFNVFFNSTTESPWQWFHGNLIPISFLFFVFIMPFILSLVKQQKNNLIQLLYSIFFFGLFLFIFKYETHLNYYPTRYIYFLFPVYTILFSLGLKQITDLFNTKTIKVCAIIILVILFFNLKSLHYAVNPVVAWEKERISNLQIDNIGVGRFENYDVGEFIKSEVLEEENNALVLDGRIYDFILILDLPMDRNNYLNRTKTLQGNISGMLYDTSSRAYVESNYFRYHQLKEAVKKEKGFFITTESEIQDMNDRKLLDLREEDFEIYNTSFEYVKSINNYKIYKWDRANQTKLSS